MLKVSIASDLHFEFYQNDPDWLPVLPRDCDILVLAGDISVGQDSVTSVFKIAKALPNTKIIWIAGNHEFYEHNIDEQIARYQEACANHSQIYFLENEEVTIDGYCFFGCTLWSGFTTMGLDMQHRAINRAQHCISDFSTIKKYNNEQFTAMDAVLRFRESCQWLEASLPISLPKKTIVVSHFPPVRQARHQVIPENLLSAYFQADCENIIKAYKPHLWIYGHNHWSDDMLIGDTRLISNQLGYPDEEGEIPDFQSNMQILLP